MRNVKRVLQFGGQRGLLLLVKFELLGVAIQMGKECNNHIGYAERHRLDLDRGPWTGEDITQASRRWVPLREDALDAAGFSKKCPASLCIGMHRREEDTL